jgi:TPR repeat protein
MAQFSVMKRVTSKSRAVDLFTRASELDERGDHKHAFKWMLAAAKLGDSGAQVNVGNFYDEGKGVRRDRQKAFYWYRRAYRSGEWAAASNIAVMWRNENRHDRAVEWFKRAKKLGDKEADLEIARHYLLHTNEVRNAIKHLERVIEAHSKVRFSVTPAGAEEAMHLLVEAKGRLKDKSLE